MVQTNDSTQIVEEDYIDVQAASDEATGLEQVIVIFLPRCQLLVADKIMLRLCEASILVDYCKLFDDIVVESIEHLQFQFRMHSTNWGPKETHNKNAANPKRKTKKAFLREAIRFQFTVLESAHHVLLFLVASV